ncbi:MAG: alanine racemase domain protein [Eubacterium sp.]|nr:alanine racemase domain protein [Eubacterium sp.]
MIDAEIKNNLDNIFDKVRAAAEKSGRTAEDIKVIAVTKTVEVDRIKNVYEYGLRDMGENRVQELTDKYDKLPEDCKWHLIGHLQTNKVKYIIDKVAMIHSVDSVELAKEINLRAEKHGRIIDILLQVNVSGEETKFGISPDEVYDFIGKISQMKNLCLKGLMTIAPFTHDPQEIRPVFKNLYNIYIDIKHKRIDNVNMDYLSMGMSNDFEVAIEEGANVVRIGTSIFGKREYTQK